ncbi:MULTISPECIES: hypothetical protein [Providencia]|uniref:hypothetical protein n=1 Tax=Providencia TaxID=586 RepID=UPI002349EC57|nr:MULTISPECIES: hypothetical protein [Providencia]EJD6581921.1 hypothetical protein [Providencia rettgeri]ELR5220120.1 hypothetical protein [Providencia rettgeri]MDX7322662.1 hypothetical protein [Providencia rettgeri]WOC02459.1 hypothetical protein P3L56_11475 [Providencia sp. PROV024]
MSKRIKVTISVLIMYLILCVPYVIIEIGKGTGLIQAFLMFNGIVFITIALWVLISILESWAKK